MKILLIIFAIIFIILRFWKSYLENNYIAYMKIRAQGNIVLSLLVISEYILGAIIIIKIILKLFN